MTPKLIKGVNLTPAQLQQVKAAFVDRVVAIGEGKAYPDEEAWINGHAFYFRKDGKLAIRPNHCEPHYMAS